ncbi:unnamed protein product, partial [Prunus brigantina]
FGGQYDRRPTRNRVFDRLGAQNPSTSAGHRNEATPRPLRTFEPPIVREDLWYHVQPGGNVQPLRRTQLRRVKRQAQQAREQIPQAEGSKRQRKLAIADEPSSVPIVLAARVASIKSPRTWRPRKDEDLREMGKTDEGIIDVYCGRDPTFSANGLSFLREFHKDHSTVDLYGLTPENREIVELGLKNTKAEGLLITRGSDSAIKAVYHQRKLEDKAPFGRSDLEYLRQYFSVTPADTLFGLTTEERAQASRLDDYLMARDALAEVRRALEKEAESSNPPS